MWLILHCGMRGSVSCQHIWPKRSHVYKYIELLFSFIFPNMDFNIWCMTAFTSLYFICICAGGVLFLPFRSSSVTPVLMSLTVLHATYFLLPPPGLWLDGYLSQALFKLCQPAPQQTGGFVVLNLALLLWMMFVNIFSLGFGLIMEWGKTLCFIYLFILLSYIA